MGKMRMGILDGFVGKVGTVVGSFWKGKKVMRGYNEFPAYSNTEPQALQRAKFGLLGEMGGALLGALQIGLKSYAASKVSTEVGEFVQLNLPRVSGTVRNLTVAYEGLELSRGTLTSVGFDEPDLESPLTVKVGISESRTGAADAKEDDQVFVALYNKSLSKGMVNAEGVKRTDEVVEIVVPGHWQGTQVEMWGFVKAADSALCSGTTYLGSGTIA